MLKQINHIWKYAFLYSFVFLWIINGEASTLSSPIKIEGEELIASSLPVKIEGVESILGCDFYAQYEYVKKEKNKKEKETDKKGNRRIRVVTKSFWKPKKSAALPDNFLKDSFEKKTGITSKNFQNYTYVNFKTPGDIEETDLFYKKEPNKTDYSPTLNHFIRNLFIMYAYQINPDFDINNKQQIDEVVKNHIIKNIWDDGPISCEGPVSKFSKETRENIENRIVQDIYSEDDPKKPYVIVGDHTLAFGYYYEYEKNKDKPKKNKGVYWFVFRLEPVDYFLKKKDNKVIRQELGKRISINYIIVEG